MPGAATPWTCPGSDPGRGFLGPVWGQTRAVAFGATLGEAAEESADVFVARPPAARRAQPARARKIAHDHARVVETRRVLRGLAGRDERHQRALRRLADHLEAPRERRATPFRHRRGTVVPPVRQS